MQARFIGDPRDAFSGPSTLLLGGRLFPKGEFVDVPEEVAQRLAGHSHFEVRKKQASAKPEPAPLGHEPDRASLEKMTKDELEAYGRAYLGIELDKRKRHDTLVQEIMDADARRSD